MPRDELIHAVEQGVAAQRLESIVSAYLDSTFGVARLGDLNDDQLVAAVRFISRLHVVQGVGDRPPPIPPGTIGEGEFLWGGS